MNIPFSTIRVLDEESVGAGIFYIITLITAAGEAMGVGKEL